MSKLNHVHFGPPIPLVPVTQFSKLRLSREQWAEMWAIIGPSVEKNLDTERKAIRQMPLWMIITAAYVEGLQHGSELAKAMKEQADE